jgi:5-methylcytosine-specific restriction endonuclease McrA
MPKGGKPTMMVCKECNNSFRKKYQGKVSNDFCCAEHRDDYISKQKIASGNYTKASALSYFRRFTTYECSECGISEWNGKALSLQIDHIDGNNTNNVVENLRYLCPNCHTQTHTWGSKNISEEGRKRLKAAAKLGVAIRQGKVAPGTRLVS